MEEPTSEDGEVMVEWAPYTCLLNQIPLKIQTGLFSQDLNLTCVDATDEYIALGTNLGLVFWYGRKKGDIQRLRCENSNGWITFVKIASSVDFMVAAGNKSGQVSIFQIPKEHPESVPDSLKPKTRQQVERYTVGDLHHSEITYIEWSKNGMKLFSGDKDGLVVMTEIDFYMHLCKSSEIINEAYEIVQISNYQNYLLVSSVFRSIICHKKESSKWEVNQVGIKDRKSLSKLGGVFHFNYEKPNDVSVYCARPGLRIWTSDKQGNVLKTLLFKDAVFNPISQVELLNPSQRKNQISQKDASFGLLYMYKDKYIVSHHENILYVVNPVTLVALATVDNFRSILSMAVNRKEMFILEGDRSLVRLSYEPDTQRISQDECLMSKSLTNPLRLVANTLKELTSSEIQIHLADINEQCTSLVNILKDSTVLQESPNISQAEDCLESSKMKNSPSDVNILDKLLNNFMGGKDGIFDDAADTNNQNIENELTSINIDNHKIKNENEIMQCTRKTKRNNFIELDIDKSDVPFFSSSSLKQENDESLQPYVKEKSQVDGDAFSEKQSKVVTCKTSKFGISSEAIEKEIEDKELILAKLLNLEPVTKSNKKLPSPDYLSNNSFIHLESNIEFIKPNNTSIIPESQVNLNNSQEQTKAESISPPECVSVPNTWNLKQIQREHIHSSPKKGKAVSVKRNNETPEEMDEWEFV